MAVISGLVVWILQNFLNINRTLNYADRSIFHVIQKWLKVIWCILYLILINFENHKKHWISPSLLDNLLPRHFLPKNMITNNEYDFSTSIKTKLNYSLEPLCLIIHFFGQNRVPQIMKLSYRYDTLVISIHN